MDHRCHREPVRTACARRAGGLFDESFVGWGLEDTELHLRLHRAGARTQVIEGGLNWHQLHPRPPTNAAEWTRNSIRLLDKHESLEVCLCLRVLHRWLTFEQANRIALDARANPDATAVSSPSSYASIASSSRC